VHKVGWTKCACSGDRDAKLQSSRKEMASRLTADDWVAYKCRGDPDQPFWIGKTLPKGEWGNQYIQKNDSHNNVTIEGAITSRGGFAINVQWYTQKVLGVPEYIIEDGEDAKPLVQSNKDLILTRFDKNMHQVYGTRARVPRQCSVQSSRMDDLSIVKELEAQCNLLKENGIGGNMAMYGGWMMQVKNEALKLAGSLL
jgi:hypothetical protein